MKNKISSIYKRVRPRSKKEWLLFIVILVIAYLGFRQVEMRVEKARYARAEKEILELSIQAAGGAQVSNYSSCGYVSSKWSRGDRHCTVGGEWSYPVSDYSEANAKLKLIRHRVSQEMRGINWGKKLYFDEEGSAEVYQDMDPQEGFSCHAMYAYSQQSSLRPEPTNLRVTFICSGSALAEYYPID